MDGSLSWLDSSRWPFGSGFDSSNWPFGSWPFGSGLDSSDWPFGGWSISLPSGPFTPSGPFAPSGSWSFGESFDGSISIPHRHHGSGVLDSFSGRDRSLGSFNFKRPKDKPKKKPERNADSMHFSLF